MKILITGVLGVVGSKLEEVLIQRGHKVFGVDLMHQPRKYGHGLGKVEDDNYFRCDIGDYRQIFGNLFILSLIYLVTFPVV